MPTVSAAVIDILNSLLDAQQNSLIRFMDEGSPYLSRAAAEIRGPLAEMLRHNHRRCHELYAAIDALGGLPRSASIQPEEQYLAFLSFKFLLPKLVHAKALIAGRYENAIQAIEASPPELLDLLRAHLEQHQAELATLQQAAPGAAPAAT